MKKQERPQPTGIGAQCAKYSNQEFRLLHDVSFLKLERTKLSTPNTKQLLCQYN